MGYKILNILEKIVKNTKVIEIRQSDIRKRPY